MSNQLIWCLWVRKILLTDVEMENNNICDQEEESWTFRKITRHWVGADSALCDQNQLCWTVCLYEGQPGIPGWPSKWGHTICLLNYSLWYIVWPENVDFGDGGVPRKKWWVREKNNLAFLSKTGDSVSGITSRIYAVGFAMGMLYIT